MTAEEFSVLKVGDIIATKRGTARVIRHKSSGYVALAIRRCSWTRRCYTLLNVNDLTHAGYRVLSQKPRRLRTKIDRLIAQDIGADYRILKLDCCDVVGIP